MAWTATLTKIEKKGGMIYPTVVFTESATQETIERVLNADDIDDKRLAEWCEKIIVSLEARDLAFPTLTVGPIKLPRDKSK